jgi:hypothetical protein
MSRLKWSLLLSALLPAPVLAGPPLPPQAEAQVRALFKKIDTNGDGFLDKDELAHHFRGPRARAPQEGMYDDKGRLTTVYYQARRKYPELVFLWSVDSDMDGRVSWSEFAKYGQAYAAALKARQAAYQAALRNAYRQRANYVRQAQRYYQAQQRQMVRNVQNWQRYQANLQRAYVAAVQRQWHVQVGGRNYGRHRRVAFHRTPQRHFHPHRRR